MMISPKGFAEKNYGKSYEELVAVRNELFDELKAFEEGRIPQEEYAICPSPDTRYQCNLEYMIEICKLIGVTYNAKSDEDEGENDWTDPDDEFDYVEESKRRTGENPNPDRAVRQ